MKNCAYPAGFPIFFSASKMPVYELTDLLACAFARTSLSPEVGWQRTQTCAKDKQAANNKAGQSELRLRDNNFLLQFGQ